jgi:nucleotide-binding universal stress UspA family protein
VKILVCIDAETHSDSAMKRAVVMGHSLQASVTALHVIDPWLKKFYNELYSQGRKEYLEYVDACLQAEAEQVQNGFRDLCSSAGLEASFKIRHGEPMVEILAEVSQTAPDLLITGSKKLGMWGRFRSRNLPRRLRNRLDQQVAVISL